MTMHAIYIDANERQLRLIDWDLSCVPHIGRQHLSRCWAHAMRIVGMPLGRPVFRAASYSEGVDTRNHVLASRVLKGRDDCIDETTPYTIRESKVGRDHATRWVLWTHDNIDRKTEQHGFRLAMRGRPFTHIFWQPAVLVRYTHAPANACSITATNAAAEARLGQPLDLTQQDVDALRVEWVHAKPVDYVGPIHKFTVAPTLDQMTVSNEKYRCEECGGWFEKLQKCAQCKAAFYCGKECQKKAWKLHKPACKAAAGISAADG